MTSPARRAAGASAVQGGGAGSPRPSSPDCSTVVRGVSRSTSNDATSASRSMVRVSRLRSAGSAIGPVDRATFDRLLPGGEDNLRLRKVVDDVTGGLLEVEAEIEIVRGEEPRAALGRRPGTKVGAQLGRSSLVLQSGSACSLRVRISLGADAIAARPVFFQTSGAR